MSASSRRLIITLLGFASALVLGCPKKPLSTPIRPLAGYPSSVDAGASPADCQALEPMLPKPLADDDVLEQFVGLAATRHSRACTDRDFHPCDPVGPHDCERSGWDKTWSVSLRRDDLSIFQRYWTLVPSPGGSTQCRYIGEVRLRTKTCDERESKEHEMIDVPALPNAVDLLTGQAIRDDVRTAASSANHWK